MDKNEKAIEFCTVLTDLYSVFPVVEEIKEKGNNYTYIIKCQNAQFVLKNNESLLISTNLEEKEKLELLMPMVKEIMDNSDPICSYDIKDDEKWQFCIEWDLKNFDKRLIDIINGRGFPNRETTIYNIKLYGFFGINQYLEQKEIRHSSDFCELFLAKYYLETHKDDDEEKIIFTPEFIENFKKIFISQENKMIGEYFQLMKKDAEELDIDIEKLINSMHYSQAKKYPNNEYVFVPEKNQIEIEVDSKNIDSICNKYNRISQYLIDGMVSEFSELEKKSSKKYQAVYQKKRD